MVINGNILLHKVLRSTLQINDTVALTQTLDTDYVLNHHSANAYIFMMHK